MKSNKGLTYLEIILSMAILGIISVGILTIMAGQFRFVQNTQKMTVNLANAQQNIEDEIVAVKEAVQNGTITATDSFTLFNGQTYQRTVKGFPRRLTIGNSSLFTVVADNRMPEFTVASASVSIAFSDGSTLVHAYKDTPSLFVNSSVTLTDPLNVNLTNIYRWYVSRPGFNIPMLTEITEILEIEKGVKYPIFPNDYMIIPGATGSDLTSVSSIYAGRHLICTATPAAQSGKMGATAASNPVFLSGLPVISDLQLHLDASLISKEDTTAVNSVSEGFVVKKWADLSGSGNNAVQTTSTKMPTLIEAKIGDFLNNGLQYETFAKYLQFDGVNDVMTTIGTSDLIGKTAFIVARATGETTFTIYPVRDSDSLEALLDDQIISVNPYGKICIGSDSFSAFFPVDVAEIIVYDGTLSDTDVASVYSYLQSKYQPVAPAVIRVTGVALSKSTTSIPAGNTETLFATITPSSAANKTVVWTSSNNAIATVASDGTVTGISAGSVVITATTADGGYTDTCSVTVTAPIRVTGVTLNKLSTTMLKGKTEQLIATIAPTNATNQNVAWNSSNTAAATVASDGTVTAVAAGTAVVTVTTDDTGKTATCTVTVTDTIGVTGVTLDKSTANITIFATTGETQKLTATVAPTNATNKNVTWSSSNTSVATVASDGTVKGIASGTADITATTVDGNKTAKCTINVRACATSIKGNSNKSFSLTFDSTISSASITGLSGVTIQGVPSKSVTFNRSSYFSTNTPITVMVHSNGITSTITVKRSSGSNYSYTQS